MQADLGLVGQDSDHVEAQGIVRWFSGVKVVFGYGAEGILFAVGYGFQWVSEAGPAPQLDFHEDERLGSLVQNIMTSEIRFHALLVEGRTGSLQLARI
jgi:hypothetical protein